MDFLWEPELALNTVHVFDVARAIYFAARKLDVGSTWNLADKGATDQKRVSMHLGTIFGIETGFYGSMMSSLAKVRGACAGRGAMCTPQLCSCFPPTRPSHHRVRVDVAVAAAEDGFRGGPSQ